MEKGPDSINYSLPGTYAVGVDIVEIARFEAGAITELEASLKRVFTQGELGYCFSSKQPAQHLAARFAGKEAIVKALLSLHRGNVDFSDIEITNDSRGAPLARIVKPGFEDLEIKLSLAHEGSQAVAFAIAVATGQSI